MKSHEWGSLSGPITNLRNANLGMQLYLSVCIVLLMQCRLKKKSLLVKCSELIRLVENVIVFSVGRDGAQGSSLRQRDDKGWCSRYRLCLALLKEHMKRAATFICQDSVFESLKLLYPLSPRSHLVCFFFLKFLLSGILIFQMCGFSFYLFNHKLKGQIGNVG